MWFFKRNPSNSEVLERLESLERRFKTLLADVDEYFQLVRRAENRIKEKRAKVEGQPEGTESNPPSTGDLLNGSVPHSGLSPHQREVQQKILRRRAGMA